MTHCSGEILSWHWIAKDWYSTRIVMGLIGLIASQPSWLINPKGLNETKRPDNPERLGLDRTKRLG
jgi:hypothetical protein